MNDPLVTLDYSQDGHAAVCDGVDCGDRKPGYRVELGAFDRFFCEPCLTRALLDAKPRREL